MDIITGEPSAHGRNSQRACIKWRSQQNVSFIHPNNLFYTGEIQSVLGNYYYNNNNNENI